jgi:hypothetical protein
MPEKILTPDGYDKVEVLETGIIMELLRELKATGSTIETRKQGDGSTHYTVKDGTGKVTHHLVDTSVSRASRDRRIEMGSKDHPEQKES